MSNNQSRIATDELPPRTAFLDTLGTNPQLAAAKLVRQMNDNAGFEAAIHDNLAAALDRITLDRTGTDGHPVVQEERGSRNAEKLQPLRGDVVVTRNKTSQARKRDLSFAPSPAELACLLAAEHLAHNLLAAGMPDALAAQADAIAHYADPIYKAYAGRRLERRGVYIAEAAARHLINHAQPADLTFARTGHLRRWYAEQCDRVDAVTCEQLMDNELARRLLDRPRLAWVHPDGVGRGLLLDRFHHTNHRGAIERDTWTRRKVAEDLASIDAFLAPTYINGDDRAPGLANLGVRIHAHRAPNVGVHFLPDHAAGGGRPALGEHHRIGGCQHCTTRTALPNSQQATNQANASSQCATAGISSDVQVRS